MLELYRRALHVRRAEPALGDGGFAWLGGAPAGVLAFGRGPGSHLACVVNLSGAPVGLPVEGEVVLASGPLDGNCLPADTAVWLRTA